MESTTEGANLDFSEISVWRDGSENITTQAPGAPATFGQMLAISVVIAVFGVWCFVGNTVTILAITTQRYMKTKTNAFILSLAISDLLSCVVASPLWLYRRTWGYSTWSWGQFVCRLYWGTDETTSYCTAMHIASFAVWRFILVRWPHKMRTIKTRWIKIWIGAIWILSIIFGGFVYSSFNEVADKPQDGSVYSHWPRCSLRLDSLDKSKLCYAISSSLFMYTPMTILLVVSVLIARELYFNNTFKGELRKIKEKRAVRQLVLIAASFLFGYLPMTIYIMWTISTKKDKVLEFWMGVIAYFCLRLSECLNPAIYNISSRKMRKASKEILSIVMYVQFIPILLQLSLVSILIRSRTCWKKEKFVSISKSSTRYSMSTSRQFGMTEVRASASNARSVAYSSECGI